MTDVSMLYHVAKQDHPDKSDMKDNEQLALAATLARCVNCKSFDVTRMASSEGQGPMDKCDHCGASWPHKPGSKTTKQMVEKAVEPVAASITSNSFILSLSGDDEMTAMPMVLEGWPKKDAAGRDIHYMRMRMANAGDWTHRGNGKPLPLPRSRLQEWVKNTTKSIQAGIKPWVTPKHLCDEYGNFITPDARDTLGYVERVGLDANGTYADVSLYGDENLGVAATNKRSVGVNHVNVRDAKGNIIEGEVLNHLALCPNPALTDLGDMTQIAASANGSAIQVPVYQLSDDGGDGEWVTLGSGVHVKIGGDGKIKQGPAFLKGKGAAEAEKSVVPAPKVMLPKHRQAVERLKGEIADHQKAIAEHEKSLKGDAGVLQSHDSHREQIEIHNRKMSQAHEQIQDIHREYAEAAEKRAKSAAKKKAVSLSADDPALDQLSVEEFIDLAFKAEPSTAAPRRKGSLMTPEIATKARATLSLSADVPDDKLDDTVAERAFALHSEVGELRTKLANAEKERDAKGQEVMALSSSTPTNDPLALSLIGKAIGNEMEQTIASGAISQVGMDLLKAEYYANGQPTRAALALSAGSMEPHISKVLKIIRDHPGIKTGNQLREARPVVQASGDKGGNADENGVPKEGVAAAGYLNRTYAKGATATAK